MCIRDRYNYGEDQPPPQDLQNISAKFHNQLSLHTLDSCIVTLWVINNCIKIVFLIMTLTQHLVNDVFAEVKKQLRIRQKTKAEPN